MILDYTKDPVTIKFLEDNHLASVIKFFKEHRINFAKLIVLTVTNLINRRVSPINEAIETKDWICFL